MLTYILSTGLRAAALECKGNLIGDLISVKNGFRIGGLAGINRNDLKANIYFSALVAEEFFGTNTDFSLNSVAYGESVILFL